MTKRPLDGVLVVELAGLAPVPFAGLILADLGATVLRIDRSSTPQVAMDYLTRGKHAVHLDLKNPKDRARLLKLLQVADILLDPYRPGVLESSILGVSPTETLPDFLARHAADHLIVGRLVGFPRSADTHARMAGHDLNYLALSGILSLLGRANTKPSFPHNLLADFAGGSLMLVLGVLSALVARHRAPGSSAGSGPTIVDINMVQGVQYLASFLRAFHHAGLIAPDRGTNLLDSGAHNYDVYETRDPGRYVSLAALEPPFFNQFLGLLDTHALATPQELACLRQGSVLEGWQDKKQVLERVFKRHPYALWDQVGMGTDACLVGVRTLDDIAEGDWPTFTGTGFAALASARATAFKATQEGWEVMPKERVLAWQDVERWIAARQANKTSKAKL